MTTPLPLCVVEAEQDSAGALADLLSELHQRAEAWPEIWIQRQPLATLLRDLEVASRRRQTGEPLPLFGVPFAVKDNIDVAGVATTAACPAFSYVAAESAPVVERLQQAGAIFLGKTNLDQFATGLSGTRSPYGIVKNPFDERFISGGSSSGSGVAVARGLCCFALGTDTAGSGRVPAALNHIVGLKPTRGALSTRGVVPACRSLDCVSVFAASCPDAETVFRSSVSFDPLDPFSRRLDFPADGQNVTGRRVGVPRPDQLEFFGDQQAAALFGNMVERFRALGAELVSIDFEPFRRAAELLYAGPWVAERLHSAGELLRSAPETLHPVIRRVLESGITRSALDAFRGQYRLAELRRSAEAAWEQADTLLLPTTPSTWTIQELVDDPIELNSRLGYYTNFANLFDLAGLALPAGFRADGLPWGVTLMGPAGSDRALLGWGARLMVDSTKE